MIFRRKIFKKHSKKPIKVIRAIIITLILVLLIEYCDNAVNNIICGIAIKNAEEIINREANAVVEKVLDNNGAKYNDLIITSKTDGKITSMQLNSTTVNSIKNKAVVDLQNRLDDFKCMETIVQLGSLCSSPMLSNRGPDLSILFDLYCTVDASFENKFTSAGVNQTLHTVILNVKTEYCLVLLKGEYKAEINNSYIISETVIVGQTPQYYGSLCNSLVKN